MHRGGGAGGDKRRRICIGFAPITLVLFNLKFVRKTVYLLVLARLKFKNFSHAYVFDEMWHHVYNINILYSLTFKYVNIQK